MCSLRCPGGFVRTPRTPSGSAPVFDTYYNITPASTARSSLGGQLDQAAPFIPQGHVRGVGQANQPDKPKHKIEGLTCQLLQ